MNKKLNLIILTVVVITLAITAYYIQIENTYFGVFLDTFSKVNWDEVKERDIVKNSIPVMLLEETNGKCKVYANNFDIIIDHHYFVRGSELARELNYDRESETLMVLCDILQGEKSKLHVWYVLEEAKKHSKKYEYFVTEWNDTTTKPSP